MPRADSAEAAYASIGLTKVLKAADGMVIDFTSVTTSHFIADETLNPAVQSAKTLTAAENAAVNALGGAGVAYFDFKGNDASTSLPTSSSQL
jgi:hypothetical protein